MKRLILILTFFAAMAQARNWVPVADDVKGRHWYADLDSVRYRSSEDVLVWIKVVDPDGGYALDHDEFYLTTDQYRILSCATYRPDGTTSGSFDTPTPWLDIVPDSVMDLVYHRLFKKPQRQQSQEY